MRASMRLSLQLSRSTKIFIALIVTYLALCFLLPASVLTKAEYNLTSSEYYFLLFAVRIPIVAVWCVAFYAYRELLAYATKIIDTPEGKHFAMLARGMGWAAWGLLVPAFIAALLNSIANSFPSFLSAASIIIGYMYVVVALIAFSLIGNGANGLSRRAKVSITVRQMRALLAVLVLVGVVFCYLISTKLHSSNLYDSFNIYFLPNWIVWTTIVVPYLYAWFIGIFAAFELILTAQRTQGVIYRRALLFLAIGLVTIIASMFALQYFRSIIPRTGHLTLGVSLMTTYVIYAVNALGCVLVIIGARRLKRIEEV